MHEIGIASSIHEAARQAVRAHGPGRLEWVRMAVGELWAVEPDLLRFAWQAVVAGGPDETARLDVEWRPARQCCAQCGRTAERSPGCWLRLCGQCGAALEIEGGDALDLRQVSFLTEENSDA